ncbi:MAG: hypothetical protein JW825_01320 [Candidatus Methanofastidiosa archaeon]|nr:hypothetical protein [Candidatus Methanofastidiosa archaeon]
MYDRILDAIGHQSQFQKECSCGLICDACDMGPCSLVGRDDAYLAPCGINKEQVVLKNLSEMIVEGMAEYNVHKHNLTKVQDLDKLIRYSARIIPNSIDYTNKINDMFREYRFPRMGTFGLGGLERDQVNICAIGPPERIYELVLNAHDDKVIKKVREIGARGINIVSLGAPGAEIVYQMGVPCIGNSFALEDALSTGCVDSIHFGKDTGPSISAAMDNFVKRRGIDLPVHEKELFRTGLEVDAEAINRSYRSGRISGEVVLLGAKSLTCTWDMEEIVRTLIKRDYLVFVNGAHLYKGTELDPSGPSVVHLGFCESGKVLNMKLDSKPIVLFPGWKNAKLLTTSLAMLNEGYRIIMGNDVFGSEKLRDDLDQRGYSVIKQQKKLLSLF